MDLKEFEKNPFFRIIIIVLFFLIPLIFFTNLTRNPYFFQITLLNITLCFLGLLICFLWFKNKTFIAPINPAIKMFIIILIVFFITSLYSYIRHSDFFKPSMISEFRRIWIFSIINCFIPFIMAHYISNYQDDIKTDYTLPFVIIWGALWLLFPYFKSDSIFFDIYGFIIWGYGIIYLFIKTKKVNINFVINIAMLGAFYASVYGIFQYFGFEIIWPKVLNPYGRRAVSTFGNPNFVSSYVLMLIPFSIFYFIKAKDIYMKIIYFLFAISYFGMIFASLTRSTLIGLFFVAAFLLMFKDYRKFIGVNLRNFKKIFIAVLLILFLWPDQNLRPLSFGVVNRLYEGTVNSISKLSLDVEKKDVYPSFHQRLLIWKSGFEMFVENPIFGKGWGSFELFYPFYQGWVMREYPITRELRTHANNAHNEVIEILSQTGIIGFGVSVFFVFMIFHSFLKKMVEYPFEKKIYIITVLSALTGMIADNMLNVSIHFAVPGMLFFFLIGIASKELFEGVRILELKKYHKIFILIGIIFLFIICKFWINQFLRETYYFKGFKEMRQNNFYTAISNLEKAYGFNKREVNNNYELANAYTRTEEIDKAIFMYEESLKTNAGYDEIYFNLGVVQKKKGMFNKAIDNFKTSLWINPLNEKAYYAVAEILLNERRDKVNELIYILEDGIKIHKANSYMYNLLGYCYENLKNYEKAGYFYRKAVENEPLNQNYLSNYKRITKKNDYKLDIFISLYRDVNVSNSFDLRDFDKKLGMMEEEFKDNTRFEFLKARLYFEKGEYQKSIDLLINIMEKDPSFYSAVYSLGIVYEKMGRYEDAINMYEQYLSLNPAIPNLRERINKLKIMK